MEEDNIPNNICCICRKPIYNWFHGQGMRCSYDCNKKFIEIFKVRKDIEEEI